MTWSIDAAFAVHMDMKSHTGYCLTLGQGSPILGSLTQTVTARSSTEAELIAMDDGIGFVEWASLYMKEQFKDYTDKSEPITLLGSRNLADQDNTSAIKLEKGGRRACGKRTRNIKIRYFYVTERIKDGTVVVNYCPTASMVADYLSKPIQGSLFRVHRNTLMGVTEQEIKQFKIDYEEAKRTQGT